MTPTDILQWDRLVLADGSLTGGEKLVAIGLSHRINGATGNCFPSIPCIAQDNKLSPRHVYRVLTALERRGHIQREHRPGTTNIYCLTIPDSPAATQEDTAQDALPLTPMSPPPDTHVTPTPDTHVTRKEQRLKGKLKEKTARPSGLVRTPPAEEQDASPSPATAEAPRSGRKRQPAKPATRIPADWQPDEASREWIRDFGVTDDEARPIITEFVRYWQKRTQTRVDWGLSFRRNGRVEGSLGKIRDGKQRRTQGPPLAPVTGACYRKANDVLASIGL